MKRLLLPPLALAAALLLAAAAAATLKPGEHLYHSTSSSGVEYHAQFRNGKPRKVFDFAWFNFHVNDCPNNGMVDSNDIGNTKVDVSGTGRFHVRKSLNGGNYTVTIHGRFRDHYKKSSGTIAFKGNLTCGTGVDSGPEPWSAPRRK